MSDQSQPRIEHCRSCNAPIIWCKHANTGRPAPIDAEPSENGNCSIYGSMYTVVVRATTADPGPFHTNHFATCPNAASHHKAKE